MFLDGLRLNVTYVQGIKALELDYKRADFQTGN